MDPERADEPIAIVGIGCRFPGGSDDPGRYWDLIVNGRDAISPVPRDRWNVEKFYDPDPSMPGRTPARFGGFVENVEAFDAHFFGIPPREAACVDPQQRMLLETAWEALEDGGMPVDPRAGGNGGVFVGISTTDYCTAQSDWTDGTGFDMYTPTGGAMSIAANRVSYCLNFRGPSMAVDTACSSSLVSIHLACRSLLNGECDFALAGGVNFILNPDTYLGFSRMSMLACDGRCKPFDARANGFARGEGAGMLLLKPLADAIRCNDRIYALIRGTAVNQDGSESDGMTMPAQVSQEEVIRSACRRAGVDPGKLAFVEAHGTGTPVGDPIEARALGTVIGRHRESGTPLYLGSVKSNIGHLESGAGIAGITKAALALYHRQIPPSLNFESPNPEIPFGELNLRVPTEPVPVSREEGAIFAGVNSFGFGGTNAHVVLESPDLPERRKELPPSVSLKGVQILPLSARSESGLKGVAASLRDSLDVGGSVNGSSWGDICHTMAVRRFHHGDARGAVVAGDRAEAVACLSAIVDGEMHPAWCEAEGPSPSDPGLVFVFCGQGPQWFAMGRQLLEEEKVFGDIIREIDGLIREWGDWSLLEELSADETRSRIQDTSIGQPAIFAVQVALAGLWRSWGIVPAAVVGHSVGEVAAAHVAGVLDLEEAARVIFHRGRCMAKAGKGAMLAAGLSPAEAEDWVSSTGGKVCLAASNSPRSVTLSGEPGALEEIGRRLDREGLFQKPLRVQYAFHSSQMDPIREELLRSLEGLDPESAALPLYSTVSGERSEGTEFGADYWWRNVRQAVRFREAIDALAGDGYRNFLELGPHPALTVSIDETLRSRGDRGSVFASLRRKEDERATLLKALGGLFASGYEVNWDVVCPGKLVNLPGYSWEREHFWVEPGIHRNYRLGPRTHPLLGENRNETEPAWESKLGKRARDLMEDHRVQDRALFPAAGYVEMALEAARQTLGEVPCDIEGLEFLKAFFLPPREDRCRIRLHLQPEQGTFRIFGKIPGGREWAKHCSGEIHEVPESLRSPSWESPFAAEGAGGPEPAIEGVREMEVDQCYRLFESRGLQYGPKFQGIRRLFRRDGEAIGLIRLSDDAVFPDDRLRLHPALLDGCFQVMIAAIPGEDEERSSGTVFLPTRIERFRFYRRADRAVWSHVKLNVIGSNVIEGTIHLLDEQGNTVAELEGFTCTAAGTMGRDAGENWLYEFELESCPLEGEEFSGRPEDYMPTVSDLVSRIEDRIDEDSRVEPWGEIYREKKPDIDRICQAYLRRAFEELGWLPVPGYHFVAEELAEDLDVAPRHHRVVERYLELLAEDGFVSREGDGWTVNRWDEVEEPAILWREALEAFPAYHIEYHFIRRFGSVLSATLRGERDPVQLLFDHEGRSAEDMYTRCWSMRRCNTMVAAAVEAVMERVPKGRRIRILEIGGGTGGLTEWVLRSLPGESVSYVFSDITGHFLTKAEERFAEFDFVEYRVLDLEKPAVEQGFDPGSFDLVLASNVVHATADLRRTLGGVRELLAPGGLLGMLEIVRPPRWIDLVFGLMEGWWAMTDERAETLCPLIAPEQWLAVLAESGFDGSDAVVSDDGSQAVILGRSPGAEPGEPGEGEGEGEGDLPAGLPKPAGEGDAPWVFFADATGIAEAAAKTLRENGQRVILLRDGGSSDDPDGIAVSAEDPATISAALDRIPDIRGIVHCWSLDLDEPSGLDAGAIDRMEKNLLSVVEVVRQSVTGERSVIPGLWLVTRGAQPEDGTSAVSLSQAPLLGISRTVLNEHPSLLCRSIDLDPASREPAEEAARILGEMASSDPEEEILFRGEGRFGRRLVRSSIVRQGVERVDAAEHSFGLDIRQPGVLDSLVLESRPRREPGPGEVEIEVVCGALNFRDVMKALGIYPTEGDEKLLLGDECAGRVTRVGDGVNRLRPGDRVAAIAPGCFGSHVNVPADLTVEIPEGMEMNEAVTLPIAFLTASYAMEHLAGISAGERVLIHAATGGVGLAAIQIARSAGAEVFATAGSPEKRDFLRGIGVKHVMDSRTLAFHDEVREITGGAGVDIVLNSLSGDAIARSLSLLGDYGRFLEIGKRDIYQNTRIGLRAFRKNVSYHAIDLSRTLKDRVPLVRSLLDDLSRRFGDGSLKPLPQLVFSHSQVVNAFRTMRQARHIGKLVINFAGKDVRLERRSRAEETLVRKDGSYLVTGGTSGFGLESARWLAEQGAGALVLLSRSGLRSEEAEQTVADLEERGVRVLAAQADVTSFDEVAGVLRDMDRREFPPLRGILHAAMVLDDAGVTEQHPERLHRAVAPKAQGAWVLHKLTEELPLDFFNFYSSFNSIIGSPGQPNYAAGNIFMEALAHARRAAGKNALAVNWGHIGETGFVSRNEEVRERLNRGGFLAMNPRRALNLMGELTRHGHTQTGVVDLDWRKMGGGFLGSGKSPRYERILAETESAESDQDAGRIRDRVLEAPAGEQRGVLREYLVQLVARVLRTSAGKLDGNRQLMELGLDSLMAVELINRMEGDLGIGVPTGRLATQTIEELTDLVLPLMTGKVTETAPAAATAEPATGPDRDTVDIVAPMDPETGKGGDRLLVESADRSRESARIAGATGFPAGGVRRDDGSSSATGDSLRVKLASAEELSPEELLAALRHRYLIYQGKNLIGEKAENRPVDAPPLLREAFLEAEGVTVGDRLDPGELELDFDAFDFAPSCHHLLVAAGDRLVAYLRLICEEEGQVIPAREIYGHEIEEISGGDPSAEISRFIHPGGEGAASGEILETQRRLGQEMFEMVDRFAVEKGIEHLFAQVHPAHGVVYESQEILFQRGPEKPCPGVNNAPAVLMYRPVMVASGQG